MIRIITIILSLSFTLSASGEIALKPIHPDESVEYTYTIRLSTENSLHCIDHIRSSLKSFRKATELIQNMNSPDSLKTIDNTGWEIQTIGFRNWANAIEGTLLKNEYLIKKLQHELALEKAKSGQFDKSKIETFEKEYLKAKANFEHFWDSFGISD